MGCFATFIPLSRWSTMFRHNREQPPHDWHELEQLHMT